MKHTPHDIERFVSGLKVPAKRSKEEAWAEIAEKIDHGQKSDDPKVRRLRPVYYSGAIAACLLLAFFLFQVRQSSVQFENHEIAVQEMILPDSSSVILKTKSHLKYHQNPINGSRQVELSGEAFFKVTKGKKFQVEFPGGVLQVLGTQFNVQAYSDETGRIDCYEGSVQIELHDQQIILTKGEAVAFSGGSIESPFQVNISHALNIPDNIYHWTNRPLKEILALICAREGYELQADEQILGLRFTGVLNLNNSKQALAILTKALNLSFDLNQDKLVILERN